MTTNAPILFWFRRDLRLTDNTALGAALEQGAPILPVFILDERILRSERNSPARLKFMLAALQSLDLSLQKLGSRLLIRQGEPITILHQLLEQTGAQSIYFNRDYTPFARQRDQDIAAHLPTHSFHDVAIHPPTTVMKDSVNPYVVFTSFKKKWLERPFHFQPHRTPQQSDFIIHPTLEYCAIPTLQDLGFGETIDILPASEDAAQTRLSHFLEGAIQDYHEGRNILANESGTSYLSPYLRLGLLSPRQCFYAAQQLQILPYPLKGIETWQSELIWRDFYIHILYHFPHVYQQSFRAEYDQIQWRDAPDELAAWQDGMTGYPVVDAAMRQLRSSGWMHNRARMIVASFLTKDLLIDWRLGERYFMQWLLDGDLAANNGGWQWSAGTGTDAQPYFRIFNPVSQSEKFDPQGIYIRRWVPELRDVPDKFIHAPWLMPTPPRHYPPRIVEHDFARVRTLAAYKAIKS